MIPNLSPTADDMAVFGKLTNEQLARAFVDYFNKALTWIDYWPKAVFPTKTMAEQATALMARGKAFLPTAQQIVEGVKKTLGITTSGIGFIPAIPAAVTWLTGALSTVTLGMALRATLIAACGFLFRWLTENSSLEAKRKAELEKIEAQKQAAIAAAKAKMEVATVLKSEGYTDAEISTIMRQYEKEAAPAPSVFGEIGSIAKWAALGTAGYYVAKATGVI